MRVARQEGEGILASDGCGHPEFQGGCAWPKPRCPDGWGLVSTHNMMEQGIIDTGTDKGRRACGADAPFTLPGTTTCANCVTEAVCKAP